MKRGPKLNLMKKMGKGGGGGGLPYNSNCELSSTWILTKKINLIKLFLGEVGGGPSFAPNFY